MSNRLMAGELFADRPINAAFVRSEMGVLGDRIDNDRLECRGSDFRDVIAAHLAATLNERQYWLFGRRSFVGAILGFSARECLIGFDEFPFAAERAEFAFAHGLADAVHHEPRRLVASAHHAV